MFRRLKNDVHPLDCRHVETQRLLYPVFKKSKLVGNAPVAYEIPAQNPGEFGIAVWIVLHSELSERGELVELIRKVYLRLCKASKPAHCVGIGVGALLPAAAGAREVAHRYAKTYVRGWPTVHITEEIVKALRGFDKSDEWINQESLSAGWEHLPGE